ncbi:hypothetical protein MSAN_00309600 [Mycena sanguinolenta]|uniref:Uncharacterized protein n=1 Tax=Mycena sanguinolenta TaxID=230812 RepID=A0A8H6ZCB7_9AGAR|nr:hypothetical protein MSAN_00309600 [Mycena sanguinolenta]
MADAHPQLTERSSLLAKPKEIFVTSAYWYPFRGIYFCLRHRYLWPLLRARFIPCLVISLIVLPTLFIFAYLPQVAFLAIFQGNLAWFNAVFLVLGEAAAIIALLFEAFFVDETLVKIFDAVLIDQGFADLVAHRRVIIHDGADPVKQLGPTTKSAVYSPFSLRLSIEFVLFLPPDIHPARRWALILPRPRPPRRTVSALALLQAARADAEAAGRVHTKTAVEVYVVWDGCAPAAADPRVLYAVSTHYRCGRCAVGGRLE